MISRLMRILLTLARIAGICVHLYSIAEASDQISLRVPEGYEIERVGQDLDIRFPMFGAVADDGRLFLAESSGLDLYAELAAGTRRCHIRVLEDPNQDGQYDTSKIFASGLVYPMGLAWRDETLYAADPPDLIALTDRNRDGQADERRVILSGFGHKDNGSLHGLVFGPDGWLYMTMGSPDGYELRDRHGAILQGDSGALIRCRPDGTDPQVVCRGFVNLIEVAFTARGEMIGTDNWFQEPANGQRDALVHLVTGGLYPYLPDTGTQYIHTGRILPAITIYPAVALSGITCYSGRQFPIDMRDSLFTAQFNARKIVHHRLLAHGSTFQTIDTDFVTTDDPDFHPADVLESHDGSLLVIDTGSWYVQHCPTGRIRQSDAHGGVYRVRYRGRRDSTALAPTRESLRERIVTVASMDDSKRLQVIKESLRRTDRDELITALRVLVAREERRFAEELHRLVSDDDRAVRRAAAEGIASLGDRAALPFLWQALCEDSDPLLEHALVHAISCVATESDLRRALEEGSAQVQRVAIWLLDQPPYRSISAEAVIGRLKSADADLRRAARHIIVRHPEWADHVISTFHDGLVQVEHDPAAARDFQSYLLTFQHSRNVQEWIGQAMRSDRYSAGQRVLLIEAVGRAELGEIPRTWIDALAEIIDVRHHESPEVRRAAVEVAAIWQLPDFDDRLERLANHTEETAEIRRASLRAIASRRQVPQEPAFELLLADLSAQADPLVRLGTGELIAHMRLGPRQLTRLLTTVEQSQAISPVILLPMLQRSTDAATAGRVANYLKQAIDSGWAMPRDLDMRDFAVEVHSQLLSVVQAGQARAESQRALLERYMPLLSGGDPERGREVFRSHKGACAACHRVASEGGEVGPDLTKLSAIRAGPDILESILFPSATLAQNFEPYSIACTDGRVLTGIVSRETADVVMLRDATGQTTRLTRGQIEEMNRQPTSLMPDNLVRQLTEGEFRDLLAYLQGLK